MKKSLIFGLVITVICCVSACSRETKMVSQADYYKTQSAVIHGQKVTGDDRLSTVVLLVNLEGSYQTFCTGTLITPNYVLTAGHCISDCDDTGVMVNYYRPNMAVGIGQNESSLKNKYFPEKFYAHPKFVCSDDEISNDIAIIKLKESVPSDVAQPALIIPPSLMPTAAEIDGISGVSAVSVGFGQTSATNSNSVGVKYETTRRILAICSNTGGLSTGECAELKSEIGDASLGFVYFYDTKTNVCSGDSGGSTFIERDGREYLLSVTSWVSLNQSGYCDSLSAMTYIEDYRSFITPIVTDLPAAEPEICDNGADDNGDGRLDCADPYCTGTQICEKEICYNGLDDDGDNQADCADSDCSEYIKCQPEICDNDKDDNDDGLVDCDDPQCANETQCHPEDCRNGEDDNGDGLVDCDDPQCKDTVACVPENCSNELDDNENGLTDCDDPQCANSEFCVPEICDNNVDDNGNGLVDCNDWQCAEAIHCQPEICDNDKDDNGNGLKDCRDPECFGVDKCPEKPEICSNSIDDNDDGRIDCDDESCECSQAQIEMNMSGSCASAPENPLSKSGFLAFLGLLAGFFGLRRRKS